MANYSSPSKIPKIHHPEIDVIHDRLQLLAYKCHDPAVNPRETGQQLCTLASDLMAIMSRWHKKQVALQHSVESLRRELITTKAKLAEAEGSAELLAASKDFWKDELNHVATQTVSPATYTVTEDEMPNSAKDFCKDGLNDITQAALAVEEEDA